MAVDTHSLRSPNREEHSQLSRTLLLSNINPRMPNTGGGGSSRFTELMWDRINSSNAFLRIVHDMSRSISNICSDIQTNRLGVVTNGINVIAQGENICKAVQNLEVFSQIGDSQGVNLTRSQIVTSSALLSSAAFDLSGLISGAEHWGAATTSVLGILGTSFSGLASVIGIGVSSYRLKGLVSFRNKIHGSFQDPNKNAIEKARETLLMLKNELMISKEDVQGITQQIEEEYPNYSDVEKESLFNHLCKDLARVKINQMKRCSGMKSVRLIANRADLLLSKLDNIAIQHETCFEVDRLVQTVLSENGKKTALHVSVLIASILSFVAVIATVFFSAGTLPFILTAIAGVIALSAIAAHWISEKYLK